MQTETEKKTGAKTQALAYAAIIFVVFVWGASPPINVYLYGGYSAAICSATMALVSAVSLLFICLPHLKKLDKDHFKIAGITGLFNALAAISQKIGLQYTTPTKYAFLENLSCVLVPILLFILIKKKPSFLTVLAALLCLASSFILSGDMSGSFGIGEWLCAVSGLLYGVNLAVTGIYAKKLYAPLYVMIQMWISAIVGFSTAIILHVTQIEPISFTWEPQYLLVAVALALVSSTLCWIIRTNVMKYINPSAVAVIMPFSAVVAGVISVAFGIDQPTVHLVVGALVGLVAAILSGVADTLEKKKEKA